MIDTPALIARLEEIVREGNRGCLCGHFESCERCDPFSSTNRMLKMAHDLLMELRGQTKTPELTQDRPIRGNHP